MAKKNSRFIDQATLESIVRFGPELSVLKQAQRQAESAYRQSVHQARSGATAVRESVGQSLPLVTGAYDRAMSGVGQAGTLLGHDLQGLGGVADSIKAGASLEAATQLGNLNASRAGAVRDLTDRGTQAAAGQIAATRAAHDQLVTDLTKILESRKDLAGQRGAFKAATIGDLEEAARERATRVKIASSGNKQSERNSVRSSGIDPDTGKPIPGGKLDPKAKKKGVRLPGGAKLATANEHGTAKDAIAAARTWIRRLSASKHMTTQTITDHLVAGDELQDSSGNKLKLPTIAGDYVQAAVDLEKRGGVTHKTAQTLHSRGLSLKQLGIPSMGSRKGKTQASVQHGFDVVQALLDQLGG